MAGPLAEYVQKNCVAASQDASLFGRRCQTLPGQSVSLRVLQPPNVQQVVEMSLVAAGSTGERGRPWCQCVGMMRPR